MDVDQLRDGLATTAIALRGYNVHNLGRSQELLEHDPPDARLAQDQATDADAGDDARMELPHEFTTGQLEKTEQPEDLEAPAGRARHRSDCGNEQKQGFSRSDRGFDLPGTVGFR